LFFPRRSFLKSLGRSTLVLSLENVLAGVRPLFAGRTQSSATSQKSTNPAPTPSLGVNFLNIAKESGLNAKTIFGGEHKNKFLLETTGCGVAFYDYDHDGWLDIFLVNGWRLEGFPKGQEPHAHLFKNNRDGTFADVTASAGLIHSGWGQGVCVGDYDNDGFDDLFVSYFGRNVLYHNNGNGTFTDVSEKAGVGDSNAYYGLTAIFADLNNDGKLDLVVADDSTPNYLYLNKGNGTFEDVSSISGYALNESGHETASMGIAVGDYRNNGLLDLYNTVFSDDYNPLYRNDGDAIFTDVSYQIGIAAATIPFLGWGTGFLDYDNDGWKDLFVANGHVYPEVDNSGWGTTFMQRPLLFRDLKGEKFEAILPVKDTGLARLMKARGTAFGDLFNDGKIDVVVNQLDDVPVLLRNVSPDKNHWVGLKLIGGPKSPRDAVGATLYLTADGIRQRGDVLSGGSYASSNDQRVHFGLSGNSTTPAVEIHWPSGAVERLTLPAVDRFFTIEEGKGIVGELCGSCATSPAVSLEKK